MKVLMFVFRFFMIFMRLLVLRRVICMLEDVWFIWLFVVIMDFLIFCSVVLIWCKCLVCVINS